MLLAVHSLDRRWSFQRLVRRRLAIALTIRSVDGFLSHEDLYRIGISIARANRVLDLFAHLISIDRIKPM